MCLSFLWSGSVFPGKNSLILCLMALDLAVETLELCWGESEVPGSLTIHKKLFTFPHF